MVRRTKAEAEQTRSLILDTAERVFFAKGVARTSLADIATAAGLTRGAIYWHFENKVELFNAMHERVVLPFSEALEAVQNAPDPLAALRERCVLDLQEIAASPRLRQVLAVLLHKCEYVDEFDGLCARFDEQVSRFVDASTAALMSAQALGQLRAGVDPPLAALALHNYMLGTISDWLFAPDHRYVLATMAVPLVDLFFAALARTD